MHSRHLTLSLVALMAFLPLSTLFAESQVVVSYRVSLVSHGLFAYGPVEVASPAFSPDGRWLVAGTSERELVVVDPVSGNVARRVALDGGVSVAPLVAGDRVFVGTDNGTLGCYELATGTSCWDKPARMQGAVRSRPVLWGEQVVVVQDDRSVLYAFERSTGAQLGLFDAESFARRNLSPFTIFGYPDVTVVDEALYAGFETGVVMRFRQGKEEGPFGGFEPAWRQGLCAAGKIPQGTEQAPALCSARRVFRDVDATPIATAEGIVTGCYCRGVALLSTDQGEVRWESRILGPSGALVIGQAAFVASADGALYSLDLATGKRRWTTELQVHLLSTPQVLGNPGDAASATLAVATGEGLYFVSGEDGRLLNRVESFGGISAAPAVAGNALFVVSNEGYLYRIDYFR